MKFKTTIAAEDAEKTSATAGTTGNHHLRRAEDFIHTNFGEEFTLLDLTEAAGTSASTLLRSFNAHHDASPMQYVKRLRLEAVRGSLLAADPVATTVGSVASEFGFRQMGRFSADYKRAFGELPSETLRRHRYRLPDSNGL